MDNQNNDTGDENFISDEVLNDLSNQNDQDDQGSEGLIPAPQAQGQNNSDDQNDQNQVPTAHEILANKRKEDEPEDSQNEDTQNQDKPQASAKALGTGNGDDQELLDIKKQALENLSPLVDKLELAEEERFETIMEILQASDDRTLVKPALEAAEAIKDESNRAQALLDVVNEVNYLTQEEKKK